MKLLRHAACLLALTLPSFAFASDAELREIGTLLLTHRGIEARSRIEQLRDSFAAQGKLNEEATMWLLLGMADTSWTEKQPAIANIQTAGEKFRANGEHFGTWLSYWTIAFLEARDGSGDAAMKAYEEVFHALDAAAAPDATFSIDTLRVLAIVFGANVDTLEPFAANSALMKPFLLQFVRVVSHDSFAQLLIDAGELDRAEEQLRATAAFPIFTPFIEGSIHLRYGQLRQRQWRLDEAREHYLKALQHSQTVTPLFMPPAIATDPWVELKVLWNLSDLDLLRGRVDEALAWNDRASKLTRDRNDLKRTARVLRNRASLLEQGGRHAMALATYEEAMTLAVQTNARDLEAELHTDLGTAHMLSGSYGTAISEFEKSIAIYQAMKQPQNEAGVWLMLAEVYTLFDANANVDVALEHATKLAKKSGFKAAHAIVDLLVSGRDLRKGLDSRAKFDAAMRDLLATPEGKELATIPGIMALLKDSFLAFTGEPATETPVARGVSPMFTSFQAMLRGKAAMDRHQFEEARRHYQDALGRNPNAEHKAGLLGAIGMTYWHQGNRTEAIRYLKDAADSIDTVVADVKVEELLTSFLGSHRRWFFELLIEMLVVEGRPMEAFTQTERARARAFLQMIGNHRFSAASSADPRLVSEAENVRAAIALREKELLSATPEEAARITADLNRAREHYRTIVIRMKSTNDEYADLVNVVPSDLTTIGADLPQDTSLVSYFVSTNAVHAWVVDRGAAHYELLPINAKALQALTCWAEQLGSSGARGVEVPSSGCSGQVGSADDAYRALIAPLRKHIKHQRLLLVPHNVLHYVPFAALRNPDTGRYLVQDYTLLFTPSASAIRFLRDKETPVDGETLVLGEPATPIPGLEPLPGAKEEATFVARRLETTPRLGADARESLFYGLDRRYDLLHVAAHAIYDANDPLFSRVALAPGDEQDGSLTVHEILSSADLRGVNLVVLSACRSGVGQRSEGDEIVGLTRALLYAGAPGVISTLWNINDVAAAKLMNDFYEHLGNGVAVADALRRAQLAAIKSEDRGDPRFWAAFMLTGDPQGRWSAQQAPKTTSK